MERNAQLKSTLFIVTTISPATATLVVFHSALVVPFKQAFERQHKVKSSRFLIHDFIHLR